MAKYTSTSIEFFLKLQWKEGMSYFYDIAEMMREEAEELEASKSTTTKSFDPSVWHRWSG